MSNDFMDTMKKVLNNPPKTIKIEPEKGTFPDKDATEEEIKEYLDNN